MRRATPLLIAALALAFPAAAPAATIVVDSVDDDYGAGPGCSLREAVWNASTDARFAIGPGDCPAGSGADVIEIPAGTFNLYLGPLEITEGAATLRGAGAEKTTIKARSKWVMTIYASLQPLDVTLERLGIADGKAPDGGAGGDKVQGDGSGATAKGGNGSSGWDGGGILNYGGTLTILKCILSNNRAGDGGPGGRGIGGSGSPGANGGAGEGGVGGRGGRGGAIYSVGPVVVRDSAFIGNHAGRGGNGGVGAGGAAGIPANIGAPGPSGGSGVGGVGGAGGSGGAIWSEASITVERSTFSQNAAGPGGNGGRGIGAAGRQGSAAGGAGGAGGQGEGGSGGTGGDAAALETTVALHVTASSFMASQPGSGGSGGSGTGGAGGPSSLASAAGGPGGSALGGEGGSGGAGGAIVARDLDMDGSVIAGTTSGTGGPGGPAVGGQGGSVKSDTPQAAGGAGGTATGGAGGHGALGVVRSGATTLRNTTLDQNVWAGGGAGGSAEGGLGGTGAPLPLPPGSSTGGKGGTAGIAGVYADSLTFRHVTASGNAPANQGGAGGAAPGHRGTPGAAGDAPPSLFKAAQATVTASLLAGNDGAGCRGSFTDGGGNVQTQSTAGSCPGAVVGDPELAPLGDFGGPTPTRRPGNPVAIDVVAGDLCLPVDQRGVTRPRGRACDAGAYERAAPDVTTQAADAVGERAATLHGTVNANGLAGTVRFEYGATTAYGAVTPDQPLKAGLAASAVSAALTGLTPGTTYHVRAVASTADGTAVGKDVTFTTRGTPPGGGPGPGPGDTTAPAFLSATMRPSAFKIRRRGRGGARLRWQLSEAADIAVTIARPLPGRRSAKRCVAPTKRNAGGKRCTRYRTIGRFTIRNAAAGAGSRAFTGKLGKRTLKRGRYRATLIAIDAAGNRSAPKRIAFRIR